MRNELKFVILIILIIPLSIISQDFDNDDGRLPESESVYTPEQDSAYYRALQENIPLSLRIRETLNVLDYMIYQQKLIRSNPWIAARKNLEDIPSEMLEASGNQKVQRQIMLEQAQYAPFVNTTPVGGARIPFSSIMDLIGLSEDVSSRIPYQLDYHAEVEIVIYSIQAKVIASLFKGVQPPGEYERIWNGRNDDGRKMPPGDYIAEVRIGNKEFIRKRIVILR